MCVCVYTLARVVATHRACASKVPAHFELACAARNRDEASSSQLKVISIFFVNTFIFYTNRSLKMRFPNTSRGDSSSHSNFIVSVCDFVVRYFPIEIDFIL